MSFYGSIPELKTVQEEKETRFNANAPFKRSKKRSFTILKQKKVIETSKSDYTSFITFIYRSFQLHYSYITFWEPVQLFLFLIQSILNLLFYHTNQKAQIIKKSWNIFTMMKLHQWIVIRVQITQNLSKKSIIQLFWSFNNFYNSSFNRHRLSQLKSIIIKPEKQKQKIAIFHH